MNPTLFYPPRRTGIIFHLAATLLFSAAGTAALVYALRVASGAGFVLSLLLAFVLYAPLPLLLYRGYALLRAVYSLERDGLSLRWGLRLQDIPLPDVEWIRPASEMAFPLPMPRLRWPGGILGARTVPELGPVEFMASDPATMLLIATPERVYAISPDDPRAFGRAFQRAIEFGSLSPLPAFSARPAAFLEQVWADRKARYPLLAGALLTAGLLLLVGLLIPSLGPVSIGFDMNGLPTTPVPPERLMLLPILAAFCFTADLLIGLFLYRSFENRPISYLLWFSSPLVPLLLLGTVLFFT